MNYLKNLLKKNIWNESPSTFIHDFYKDNQYKQDANLLGWIYLSADLPSSSKDFVQLQKQLFDNAYNIGMLISKQYMKAFDLSNAQLIAYNFEKNQTFDYFRNLFICKLMS